MNQNFTTEIKDTICSKCECDNHFLHRVWDGVKENKMCTSCVLLGNREYFCPGCFALHDFSLGEKLKFCKECETQSHSICFSPNGCPFCNDPRRMIFLLKNLKEGGVLYKGIDEHAVELLLTAATLVKKFISEKKALSEEKAWKIVEDAVKGKKDATADVISFKNQSRKRGHLCLINCEDDSYRGPSRESGSNGAQSSRDD